MRDCRRTVCTGDRASFRGCQTDTQISGNRWHLRPWCGIGNVANHLSCRVLPPRRHVVWWRCTTLTSASVMMDDEQGVFS
jgi:hypothetical protein